MSDLRIYGNMIEPEALNQVYTLEKSDAYKNNTIRIMPDCHAGKGCTVGTTMIITDKITPNLVGVDIGCTVSAHRIELPSGTDICSWFDGIKENLDDVIRCHVPSGMNIRDSLKDVSRDTVKETEGLLDTLIADVTKDRALYSLGTLGGGNHFISLEYCDDEVFLMIHCGSRHLGVQVCKYWQNIAKRNILCHKGDIDNLVKKLKSEGREKDIQSEIKKIKRPAVSNDLAYLDKETHREDFDGYLHDMEVCQSFATLNHQTIASVIAKYMGWKYSDEIYTMHNYIERVSKNKFYSTSEYQPDDVMYVLRKGAISAYRGEAILIPMNMRDGSLICVGKGNTDWNCSAPHGAGRIMSRSKAKEQIDIELFAESMKGIYSTSVNMSTIDEAPMAYKPMDVIVNSIHDTAIILYQVKPLYNFKANS